MTDKPKKKKEEKKEVPEELKELFEEAGNTCSTCGGVLEVKKISLDEFQHGKLYIIEEIPALVCENCGETWIPKPYMEEFEQMINAVKKHKKTSLRHKKKPPAK